MKVDNNLEQVRLDREILQTLLRSPGWALLVDKLRTQAQRRERELTLKPVTSIDEALKRNLQVGIYLGIRLAVRLPTALYEDATTEFQQLLDEELSHGTTESNTP